MENLKKILNDKDTFLAFLDNVRKTQAEIIKSMNDKINYKPFSHLYHETDVNHFSNSLEKDIILVLACLDSLEGFVLPEKKR